MSLEPAEPTASTPGVLDESKLLRSVIRLAWPVVVQQVSFSMVQLVDTALVGHLGEDALAGVRLGGQLLWISMSGLVAVGVGATAVIARAVGGGRPDEAGKTLNTAMILALVWGLLVGLGMWFLGSWSLGMLGAEPGAKHEGGVYLEGLAVGMPFWSLIFAGSSALQGAGDTRTPMVVGVLVNIVNGVLSYMMINGTWIAPRMEVLGSGAGFAGAAMIGSMLIIAAMATRPGIIRWSARTALHFDRDEARRVLNVGVPSGLEQFQFSFAFMIYTRIIASLGTTALAAHGVTLAIQSLTFNVGFAISIATSAIVGQSLGAGRPDLAQRSTYLAMWYSMGFMAILGITLMVLGEPITDVFIAGEDADEVVHIGGQLLFIFGFAMPALGSSLSISGALRGAGDTRSVLLIMAGSTWIVRLIPAYLLAIPLGLGVPGAWVAAIIDINTRSLLMYLRFRQGKWKHIKV